MAISAPRATVVSILCRRPPRIDPPGRLRLLTAASVGLPRCAAGVALAALGLLALQALGGWYVDAAIGRASDTYGLFATVIGLLSWLSLAAQLILVTAEVNAVLSLGLWPVR